MGELKKWKKYYHLPEIENIRQKIVEAYSNKLQFIEESHQYFLDGEEFMCVSDVIDRWCSIDEEKMLDTCAAKAKKYPNYKYYGKTREEIAEEWKKAGERACVFGTSVHAFAEGCFYWFTGQEEKIPEECKEKFINGPSPTNKHEEAALKFWNDLPDYVVPVLAETKVFNKDTGKKYAGTFDLLLYYVNEKDMSKNGLLIGDYKTNGSLTNDYARSKGEHMLSPFNGLVEESLSHYILQFSLYAIPMQNLGFKVIGRRLIWLKPDGTYDKIKTEDMSDKLRDALDIKKIIIE